MLFSCSGFRRVFALAGQHNKRTQLSYRMDWFDTSVVEVSRHDLPAFTMNLHAFLVKVGGGSGCSLGVVVGAGLYL